MADDFQNLVVGDDDQAVDIFLQLLQTFLGLDHALLAFERERLRDNADGQASELLGNLCKQRGCTSAGAAAQSCGQEDHVRAVNGFADCFFALHRRLAAVVRISAGAQAVLAELNLVSDRRHVQSLQIRVRDVELHALNTFLHHPVHRIVAGAADSENLDLRYLVIS